MLVFGVDIPLVEILFVFGIITFLLLLEGIIIIILITSQLKKMKSVAESLQQLLETVNAGRKK